ncbi:type II toxin-antitoxin system RelE/ParE family toxin [candidate division KSB1 bacterium]
MRKLKKNLNWKVKFKKSVFKELEKLPRDEQILVISKIETVLLNNPFSGLKLKGRYEGLWRFRIGDYRIIYEIQQDILVILILRISHRKDAYSLPL